MTPAPGGKAPFHRLTRYPELFNMRIILVLLALVLNQVPLSLARASVEPAKTRLTLTKAEQEWLRQHRTIRVSVNNPTSYHRSFAGQPCRGMAYDYLSEACRRLGIAVEPVPGLGWRRSIELLGREGGVDLVLKMPRGGEGKRLPAIALPYLTSPLVIFTRKDGPYVSGLSDLAGKVVAGGEGIRAALKRDLPSATILPLDNPSEALKAVSTGKAVALVENLAIGSYAIQQGGIVDIKVAASTPYPEEDLAMGVRNDWPELSTLIGKALSSLTSEEHEAIRHRWLTLRYEHGIRGFEVGELAALFAGVGLAVVWLLRRVIRSRTAALCREVQLRSEREKELEREIAEKRTVESALQESERRFREMLANLRLIAIMLDTEDRVTFCNDFLLELTGWQRSEVLGKNWFEIFFPDPEESARTFHEGFRAGPALHRERTIVTRQGSRRVISWNSTVLRRPDGGEIGVASIGEDITGRRQYETALQSITAGVSAATGAAFFQSLVSHLAQALEVEYALIGEIRDDGGEARIDTVAVWTKGEAQENFSYALEGSPCCQAENGDCLVVERGLCALYPGVCSFPRMGMESYAGVPLRNASGDFLGVLSVLSSTPFPNREVVESMLGIFAVRAAAEIERTKAEEALKKSEAKYRLLFDRMVNGYSVCEVVCDDQGKPVDYRFVEVNSAFETLSGLKRHDLIGRTMRELVPRADEIWIERLGTVAVSGQPDQFEAYSARLRKWLKIAAYSPEKGYFGATLYDITERKLAKAALRESEEHVRQIFAQSDDGLILFEMDTFNIIEANPAALHLYGTTREELRELKPWAVISPNDFRKLIRAIPKDDRSVPFQMERATCYKADGSTFMVAIRGKILTLRNEYVILCSVRDITNKVRLEEEMKATQAKLIHTNKMTSLGMLTSGIAHEINNPNNYISVNSLMLSDVWRDAQPILGEYRERNGEFNLGGLPFSEMETVVPRLLSGITEGSSRIARIVNNMRDFVRKDDRGEGGSIDINRTIESAASLLWHHIDRHTESFAVSLDKGLPPAKGSAQQIEQVIINLIMNALQALPGKEYGVLVKTALDQGSGMIMISVIDDGYGMNKKVRNHLTEPFFSTKIDKGGTGLGLYISSSIIKEHHGSLSFESAPGKGTTATIRLPVAGGWMEPVLPSPSGTTGGNIDSMGGVGSQPEAD